MLTMGLPEKLAKREHYTRRKFGGLVWPARADFPQLPHALVRGNVTPARAGWVCSQKMTRGGTGTWHSFAGVSQRSTLSQKRGMSS